MKLHATLIHFRWKDIQDSLWFFLKDVQSGMIIYHGIDVIDTESFHSDVISRYWVINKSQAKETLFTIFLLLLKEETHSHFNNRD